MDEHLWNGREKKQDWAEKEVELQYSPNGGFCSFQRNYRARAINPSVLSLAGLGWRAPYGPVLHVGHLRECVTLGEVVLCL